MITSLRFRRAWHEFYLFSLAISLCQTQALAIECDHLEAKSRNFCEQVNHVMKGKECTQETGNYCSSISQIFHGKDCETMSDSQQHIQCHFIEQGYLKAFDACAKQEANYMHAINAHLPSPTYCDIGRLLRYEFRSFNEKRSENIINNEFKEIVEKECQRTHRHCTPGALAQTDESPLQHDVEIKTVLDSPGKKCTNSEIDKAHALASAAWPSIENKATTPVSGEEVGRFFANLVRGLEENRSELEKNKPRYYGKGEKIGNYVLPCALQTQNEDDQLYLYLEKMDVKDHSGASREVELEAIGQGTYKIVNIGLEYKGARLVAKAEALPPLRHEQIQDMEQEFALAKQFKNESYIASAEAQFVEPNRVITILPYYPHGGEDLPALLNIAPHYIDHKGNVTAKNRQSHFVEDLPREQFMAKFGQRLFEGLESFHARGLIHRDIKPENLRVVRNEEGEFIPKIIDFGTANAQRKKLNSTERHRRSKTAQHNIKTADLDQGNHQFAGTPIFFPPEYEMAFQENEDLKQAPPESPPLSPVSNSSGTHSGSLTKTHAGSLPDSRVGSHHDSDGDSANPRDSINPFRRALIKLKADSAAESTQFDTWSGALTLYEIGNNGLPQAYSDNNCPGGVHNYQELWERCGIDCREPHMLRDYENILCGALNPNPLKRTKASQMIQQFKTFLSKPNNLNHYYLFPPAEVTIGKFTTMDGE